MQKITGLLVSRQFPGWNEHAHCVKMTDLTLKTGSQLIIKKDNNSLVEGLAAAVISVVGGFFLRSLSPVQESTTQSLCFCVHLIYYTNQSLLAAISSGYQSIVAKHCLG